MLTPEKYAALHAALSAPLDPARVKVGEIGPLSGVPYLDGEDVIRTANEIFGFGGWGFRVLGLPIKLESGTYKNGTAYEVWAVAGELTVTGCEPVSDVGSNIRSGTGPEGLEMSYKGAATDCLKRCLVRYGDQFGLVLRDKDTSGADIRQQRAEWEAQQGAPAAQEPPKAQPPAQPREQPANGAPAPVQHAAPAGLPSGILRTQIELEGMGLNWNHDIVRSILGDGGSRPIPRPINEENVRAVFERWMGAGDGRKPSTFLIQVKTEVEREKARGAM